MPSRFLQLGVLLGAAVTATACFPPDDGRDPPLDRIYFPVGLAVSGGNHKLYVANSDFDLQFNAGSLQVYDIDRLRDFLPLYCTKDGDCAGQGRVCDLPGSPVNEGCKKSSTVSCVPSNWCVDPNKPRPCGALGEKTDAERLLAPGRCAPLDTETVQIASVGIGAFVTDVIYLKRPDNDCGRLFMPVRGDATLHWADVLGDAEVGDCGKMINKEIVCGQGKGRDRLCDDDHRRGENPAAENTRDISLPAEPFAIAADDTGRAIVTTHQIDGAVALFVNDWSGPHNGPNLEHVLGGLPTGVIGISFVPEPAIVTARRDRPDLEDFVHQPGFLAVYRNSPQVTLLRFFDDAAASPERPFLVAANSAPITALAQGFNSRGIAVDPTLRQECEKGCAREPDPACVTSCETCRQDCGDAQACLAQCPAEKCEQACAQDVECLTQCAGVPLDVFITNRTPASLILGETKPDESPATTDVFLNYENVPLSFGPSRVVTGNIIDRNGALARRVFIVCFDSRSIFIYDPQMRRIEAEIHTGRGPHAFAVATDPEQGFSLGFIGHFTDSYIGVVDLDQRHANNYGEIVLTIGEPTPPRASK